jgi:predicted dehydrogenase
MIRMGFVGAGRRANAAHYPAVAMLENARLEAICDLDPSRLKATADRYGVERRYADYRRMLAEADIDAVCVVMAPHLLLPIVLDCLAAGKHVFVEKPPAMSVRDLELMVEAAERNRRLTAVGFQRRFAAVAQEARRRVLERGPVTMCLGEFHKNLLGQPGPDYGVSTLLDDVIHAVDFVRYTCGGEAVEVHAFRDRLFAGWRNCYSALIRFSTGAVGIVSANRSSGGRVLRFEIHGHGIGAYVDMPESVRFLVDNQPPVVVSGAELAGSASQPDYEGTLALHRHFVECLEQGRQPLTSFGECLGTMRLVEQIEGV